MGLILRALAGIFSYFRFAFTSFWFWASTWLIGILPQIIGSVLKLLGIGLASFVGFNFFLDSLAGYFMDKFGGISSDLLQILLLFKLDLGLSMMFSAMAVSLSIRAATTSAKVIWNKPSNLPGGGMEA